MDWRDIACIVFVCTAANHLGLIAAIERVIRHSLPVVNCPKCLTFWTVLVFGVAEANSCVPTVASEQSSSVSLFTLHYSLTLLAISFLCSYLAIWLELIMFAIDTLYNRIYGTIEENNHEESRDEG